MQGFKHSMGSPTTTTPSATSNGNATKYVIPAMASPHSIIPILAVAQHRFKLATRVTPSQAISSCSGVGRPTSSTSCTGTAPAFASSPNGSEHGVFLWPSNVEPGGMLMLTSAQLSMLVDGVDWRTPERHWRPAVAG
jgi:hypothetical protein